MRFRVGSEVFRLSIEEAPLLCDDGQEVFALTETDRRRLKISTACPPEMRMEALVSILHRAWLDLGPGIQQTPLACLLAVTAIRDLEQQGGSLALKLMGTSELAEPMPLAAMTKSLTGQSAGASRECGVCSTHFSPHQVAAGPARPDPETGERVVDLAAYCDHCGHVMRWAELANGAGRPGGVAAGDPEYLKGEAVVEFQRMHPQRAGAYQVG